MWRLYYRYHRAVAAVLRAAAVAALRLSEALSERSISHYLTAIWYMEQHDLGLR